MANQHTGYIIPAFLAIRFVLQVEGSISRLRLFGDTYPALFGQ